MNLHTSCLPNGKTITCTVDGNAPYIAHRPLQPSAACVGQSYVRAPPQSSTVRQSYARGCLRSCAPTAPCGGDAHGDSPDDYPVAAPAAEIVAAEKIVEEDEDDPPIDQGVDSADAKTEATSLEHLMTHLPKNAHCSACQRAKMVKQHARTK